MGKRVDPLLDSAIDEALVDYVTRRKAELKANPIVL
jgi:hypothetical protein